MVRLIKELGIYENAPANNVQQTQNQWEYLISEGIMI